MKKTATNSGVVLRRTGPYVRIDLPPALVRELAVGRVTPRRERGVEWTVHQEPLFAVGRSVQGATQAVMPAGLESVLRGRLTSAGVPFTVRGATPVRPLSGVAIHVGITDPDLVDFVVSNERGLVLYGMGVEMHWLIAQLCLALTTAKVVVIVRRREEAKALTRLLMRNGIEPTRTTGGVIEHHRRVTVTLLGKMGFVEPAKADVVLVADALFAAGTDPLTAAVPGPDAGRFRATGLLERLADATNARVFGFLPRGRHRSPFDSARCWQAYGPNELVVVQPGVVERRPAVAVVPVSLGGAERTTVNQVKNRVRMNATRNRRLARVAAALHAGDAQKLHRACPGIAFAGWAGVPQHVLLVVESGKQAGDFEKRLPWPVVSGLGDDPRVARHDIPTVTRGVIATALGVKALDGGEFDVIVRADPGDDLPLLPSGWRDTTATRPRRLLLVDARDDGHHLAALWSRQRRRAYRAAGFSFAGEGPDVTDWERFRALVRERRARP